MLARLPAVIYLTPASFGKVIPFYGIPLAVLTAGGSDLAGALCHLLKSLLSTQTTTSAAMIRGA